MVTAQPATVSWVKCQQGRWCDLASVNLANVTTGGVYVIWQTSGQVVYVGQGNVAERLEAHRRDAQIMQFSPLLTTWAEVDARYRDGIERFLADKLSPFIGRHPAVPPTAVNLPQ